MNLLTEYITLKQKEKDFGFALPHPTYLFIEHYGRRLDEELPQIAEAFGVTDYFSFSADVVASDSTPSMSFFSTLQKNTPTGQTFQGCILISLSERISADDFNAIVALIKNSDGIIPIFTQRSDADISHLLPTLKSNFFLRTVEGEPYPAEEQLQIVENELQRYGLTDITEEAKLLLSTALEECKWQPYDHVQHDLKTIVQNLAYDKLINQTEYTLFPEDITDYFTAKTTAQKPFPIGFAHN